MNNIELITAAYAVQDKINTLILELPIAELKTLSRLDRMLVKRKYIASIKAQRKEMKRLSKLIYSN